MHDYEPTPGDLVRTEGADLVVTNGMGIDDWLLTLVGRADAPHVVLSDVVDPMPQRRSGRIRERRAVSARARAPQAP